MGGDGKEEVRPAQDSLGGREPGREGGREGGKQAGGVRELYITVKRAFHPVSGGGDDPAAAAVIAAAAAGAWQRSQSQTHDNHEGDTRGFHAWSELNGRWWLLLLLLVGWY